VSTNKGSTLDSVTAAAEAYVVVSAQEQNELLERYRAGETARTTPLPENPAARLAQRRLIRDAESARDALVGSLFRLALYEAGELVRARYAAPSSEITEEAHAEAYAALAEALATYEPSELSLAGLVAHLVRIRVRNLLSGNAPDSWDKVTRIAAAAEADLTTALGRVPTTEELRSSVYDYSMSWARIKVQESGADPAQVEELARKKLIRQGTNAAIEKLETVRARTRTPLSLDNRSVSGESFADLLTSDDEVPDESIIAWLLASSSPADAALLGDRFGINGATALTYEQLAEKYDEPWTALRTRLNATLARLYAPHAHFLFSDATLSARCEHEESDLGDSPATRLSRRRAH
jgi:hypothetical protein